MNIECRVTEVRELGSHDMFMAEIVNVSVDEELMEEKGEAVPRRSRAHSL